MAGKKENKHSYCKKETEPDADKIITIIISVR